MKNCRVCNESKPFSSYHKDKYKKDGYCGICKECASIRLKKYYTQNREELKNRSSARYRDNPEKCIATMKLWTQKNRAKSNAIKMKWAANNPEKTCVISARIRLSHPKAAPKWANTFFMSEMHDLARRRTKATGIKWDVDHIVPLKSKIVCGLHVEANMQVIPKSVNAAKGNKIWPDMAGV